MTKVNAIGDACPIPVVKTKNAIKELNGAGVVETAVDNKTAVENLEKMATDKGYAFKWEQTPDGNYKTEIIVGDGAVEAESTEPKEAKAINRRVVVISSNVMGSGNDELGGALIKSFIFALTQQDELPTTLIFYNGGAKLSCEGSPCLEDIKQLEEQGVEIMTCGTCLNFYGLTDKLQVGGVSNMYVIAEKLLSADLIIKP